MTEALSWVRAQFSKLSLVVAYFRALVKEWLNIIFGETLVGIAFLLWWALANPSNTWLILVFVVAMFVAGYYAWRAERVKLIPRFRVDEFISQETTVFDSQGMKNGWSTFFQLLPKCLTDHNVEECRGLLTSIEMWDGFASDWQRVESEVMFLQWSHGDASTGHEPITLYPHAERRLNVFFVHSSNSEIRPCVTPFPVRFITLFNQLGLRQIKAIRFNIRVVAKDCPAVRLAMTVRLTDNPFKPTMELEQTACAE